MSWPDDYHYAVAQIPPEDGGGYVVRFPDIPGCLGIGETPEEAIAEGKQALFACLDALKAVDRKLPAPSAPAGLGTSTLPAALTPRASEASLHKCL